MKNLERGQGIVEYALVFILLAIVVIVVGAVFYDGLVSQPVAQPDTLEVQVHQTLDAYEQWVDTCVAQERVDRATCEQLGLGVKAIEQP